MNNNKQVYFLKGAVQNYAWGGYDFIPRLLKIENVKKDPFAEYWLGTHQRGPAKIYDGLKWQMLGDNYEIPYLLKILDVRKMLSIQTHPNKQQAEVGFKKEENLDIPKDASNRSFKDQNHKPELMLALSNFWLLHGFLSIEEIKDRINRIPEFEILKSKAGSTKELYNFVMTLDKSKLTKILSPLKSRLSKTAIFDKGEADYWAKQAFEDYGIDNGIFSIYFLNLVNIPKGKAIYQEAGIPHAYLEGKNVEIMSNSDNVIRAGLTPKHIAIDLLLSHLNFDAVEPNIIEASSINNYETIFLSPSREFELHSLKLSYDNVRKTGITTSSHESFFVIDGSVQVTFENIEYVYQKGESFFVSEGTSFELETNNEVELVRVVVP